ncbi:MAG: lysyl-tRNA synthetase class I [Cenarchaeum symbiont of Oopsacas minuta]|nr:lysyl-tRNA synthetase class I [Cenarchaeum symbiont of Oopsacas minuta]
MDEYHELEKAYFAAKGSSNAAKDAKMRGLYEYVNLLQPPKTISPHVKYRLAIELARIFKKDRTTHVVKKLVDYGAIKNTSLEIERLVTMAGNYVDDFGTERVHSIDAKGSVLTALLSLADSLESDPDGVQNAAYESARRAGAKPRDVFTCMYQILLGSESGPRLGPFMADMGPSKVASMIRESLK